MKLLVCGGRRYNKREFMYYYLDDFRIMYGGDVDVLINGRAVGADLIAWDWAIDRGIEREPYPALWEKYGLKAGPIRNQQMLDEGKPDLVIAFPGDTGTADMVARAKKAGVKVIKVEEDNN